MHVLFLAPPCVGLAGEGGGVLAEMRMRASSLARLGHTVTYLDGWKTPDWSLFDLAHLFMANGDSLNLGRRVGAELPLVVSPILDRTAPALFLRAATWLDRLPFARTHLGAARELCAAADALCLRSRDELRRTTEGLGVHTPWNLAPLGLELPSPLPSGPPLHPERPYLLFVGDAGNPRKNVLRLIDAARELDADLVLAGGISPGPTGDAVRRCAEEAHVYLAGFLDEGTKWRAVRDAACFVLPSMVEGIGLAAVEAALLGTTVVVTQRGGAPDYLGDAAYYIDPGSVVDIRRALQDALACPIRRPEEVRSALDPLRAGRALVTCYEQALTRSAAQEAA